VLPNFAATVALMVLYRDCVAHIDVTHVVVEFPWGY
jgi:hypothetical protein